MQLSCYLLVHQYQLLHGMLKLQKQALFDIQIHKLLLYIRGEGHENALFELLVINSLLFDGMVIVEKLMFPFFAEAKMGTKKTIIIMVKIEMELSEILKSFDMLNKVTFLVLNI